MRESSPGGGSAEAAGDDDTTTDAEPMVAVYRHDVHKLRMRPHASAAETVAGTRVNETVPCGADGDAALLSRPAGEPEQTLDNHESPYRRSLLTGDIVAETADLTEDAFDAAVRELLAIEDPEAAHTAWLDRTVPGLVNESLYYPYTSLKYHTLLAAALLDNYRAGFDFAELSLAVEPPGAVTPHRTVLVTRHGSLCVTGEPGDRPAARLGAAPTRSFADVWARLPAQLFDVDAERRWRVLDAQLRRIRSWSVALQFVEEYIDAFAPALGTGARTVGGDGRGP